MPTIPAEGDAYEFYSSEQGPDIGLFPGGLIAEVPNSIPIRLQRGDKYWGGLHIATKHGHWLDKQNLDVHEMVWLKLRQQGAVYTTEQDGKLKISLRIHPSALMILRHIETGREAFMTVVSVYFHPNSLDGTRLAAYSPLEPLPSRFLYSDIPKYSLPVPPPPQPAPSVRYKKRRTVELPASTGSDGTDREGGSSADNDLGPHPDLRRSDVGL